MKKIISFEKDSEEHIKLFSSDAFSIDIDNLGFIYLDSASGYKPENVKDRYFNKHLKPYFSEDYKKLFLDDYREVVGLKQDDPVYSGIDGSDKLPNITIIPNLKTKNGSIVMGCTMGHTEIERPENAPEFQEVYEFIGYGAMVIQRRGKSLLDFIIADTGDKVLVPWDCNMTIYNLSEKPLITLDYAHPESKSNKTLQEKIGPVFCMTVKNDYCIIRLNNSYVNRDDGFGVECDFLSYERFAALEYEVIKTAVLESKKISRVKIPDLTPFTLNRIGAKVIKAEEFLPRTYLSLSLKEIFKRYLKIERR